MSNPFVKATKTQARLRMALIGPSGSGKTYSALGIAQGLGDRIALIDTERGSASKYADNFEFDVLELERFDADSYINSIAAAEEGGYDVLIIDSLSHAWAGKAGILEFVDAIKGSNERAGFSAWGRATPRHNSILDAILGARCHVIATMRSKMKYVQEQDDRGKTVIRKAGLEPVQRDGVEYEFDIVGEMEDATLRVGKSRYTDLTGQVIEAPNRALGAELKAWLSEGEPIKDKPRSAAPPVPEPRARPASPDDRVPERVNWSAFWGEAKGMGYTTEQVHQFAGTDTIANWEPARVMELMDQLRALHDREEAGARDDAPETPPAAQDDDYGWAPDLRSALEESGVSLNAVAQYLGHNRGALGLTEVIDHWLKEDRRRTPHSLVSAAADAQAVGADGLVSQ